MNLDVTTRDEINAELLRLLDNRQALRDVSSELHRRGSRAQGYELKGASLLDSRAPSSPDFTRDQALVHQTQPSSTTC